jgi:Membrane domain of glycerophosphoryl diester phosphodiesterase
MANISAAAPTAGEFRVGHVFTQAAAVLSRNFLTFFVVALVAGLPRLLFTTPGTIAGALGHLSLGLSLSFVLNTLGQAIVVYAAFQDMCSRPVDIGESLHVALRRLLSIIGIALCMGTAFLVALALPAAIAGFFMRPHLYVAVAIGVAIGIAVATVLLTMWIVAIPACVVERRGPLSSIARSGNLTKGHRWRVFGMLLLLLAVAALIGGVVRALLGLTGSSTLTTLGTLAWIGVWGAFYATIVVVTYHDLRVAKEGVDVHQIASVFD